MKETGLLADTLDADDEGEAFAAAVLDSGELLSVIEYQRAVHAEAKTINDATVRGVSPAGGTLFVTTRYPWPRLPDRPGALTTAQRDEASGYRECSALIGVPPTFRTAEWYQVRDACRQSISEQRKGILVYYRRCDVGSISDEFAGFHTLWVGIDGPKKVRLNVVGSTLGPPVDDQPLSMTTPVPPATLPPYGYVLADFLWGHAHSVIGDEAVEVGRIFDPILH